VQFLCVYIHEAHPVDGLLPERQTGTWLMGSPERCLVVEDPLTDEERLQLAQRCEGDMQLGFPMLVDHVDDAINKAYAAWPERLYLLDLDGTVVYRGGKGPMDYHPEELEGVLAELTSFYGQRPQSGLALIRRSS
jgi:hypothetical protein